MAGVTKNTRVIVDVLRHARAEKLALPEAVESYRKVLREAMRRKRRMQREYRKLSRYRIVAYIERAIARQRLESARVRRLQRRFPSWQRIDREIANRSLYVQASTRPRIWSS